MSWRRPRGGEKGFCSSVPAMASSLRRRRSAGRGQRDLRYIVGGACATFLVIIYIYTANMTAVHAPSSHVDHQDAAKQHSESRIELHSDVHKPRAVDPREQLDGEEEESETGRGKGKLRFAEAGLLGAKGQVIAARPQPRAAAAAAAMPASVPPPPALPPPPPPPPPANPAAAEEQQALKQKEEAISMVIQAALSRVKAGADLSASSVPTQLIAKRQAFVRGLPTSPPPHAFEEQANSTGQGRGEGSRGYQSL